MKDFKKKYKKLYKAYIKKFKKHSEFLNPQDKLDYFVDYLRFVRDYLILSEPITVDGVENIKTASIASAIAEFEAYKDCFNKYFEIDGNLVKKKATCEFEDYNNQYAKEKAYHWACFWELVKLNIESWFDINDTIQ